MSILLRHLSSYKLIYGVYEELKWNKFHVEWFNVVVTKASLFQTAKIQSNRQVIQAVRLGEKLKN
ncbi:CLUMA_CG020745, isoform A [Clunio marinus]|uniref:CLUMA_CG020745, isoform A n=1 Tax=Clunio marinus TaxID=568069 RepID=A0A1J1J5X1_9DIPT|nr:CLUMA_CG020745, isoform A [Clunio marinus]